MNMNLKRITMVLATSLMFAGIASAQQSKSDPTVEFNPHWYIQLQGGAGYTVGETGNVAKLLSPAAYLNVGYNFSPYMGVRLGAGGFQGKGYMCYCETGYQFKFVEGYADLMFNVLNGFGGYDHARKASLTPFFGVGMIHGFDNAEAKALHAKEITDNHENLKLTWPGTCDLFAGRVGLQFDYLLTKDLSLNIEGVANGTSDKFNSKDGDNIDWQINALLGLTYRFGETTRPSAATYTDKALAEALAAAAAAEQAAQAAKDQAAKDVAAAKKAADDAIAAAQAKAAQDVLDAQAAAKKAVEARAANVFFKICSAEIRPSEKAKLDELISWLLTNDYKVSVVGYADKNTGSSTYNNNISNERAAAVAKYLKANGIAASRIDMDHKGDTIQPFKVNEDNRVVICAVE